MQVDPIEAAGDREPFVPLLLEADESEPVLRAYLRDGRLFEIVGDDRPVGVVLLIADGTTLEIKNIAIEEGERGKGFGTAALEAIATLAPGEGAQRLLVGTADGAPDTIAFYRSRGFEPAGRREGFFDAYPEPVVIDGVVAHDMVLFARRLEPPTP